MGCGHHQRYPLIACSGCGAVLSGPPSWIGKCTCPPPTRLTLIVDWLDNIRIHAVARIALAWRVLRHGEGLD